MVAPAKELTAILVLGRSPQFAQCYRLTRAETKNSLKPQQWEVFFLFLPLLLPLLILPAVTPFPLLTEKRLRMNEPYRNWEEGREERESPDD